MRFPELVAAYPLCFHLTAAGAWPDVKAHGLLSTARALAAHGRADDPAGSAHRPQAVRLQGDERLPTVLVRDQVLLAPAQLPGVLIDMTSEQWLRALNARVFFYVREADALALSKARAYRTQDHELITLTTRSLINACASRVQLAHLNTGTVQRGAGVRGSDTFRSIDTYAGTVRSVKELTVLDAVTPVLPHVVSVQSVTAGTTTGTRYERPAED